MAGDANIAWLPWTRGTVYPTCATVQGDLISAIQHRYLQVNAFYP
jgi:hypothetical protein